MLKLALTAIDTLHAEDPKSDGGQPAELLYAQRMTTWLDAIEPAASPELRLATRAQHLCRWRIPRTDFKVGKAGYNAWRRAEQTMHAELAAGCMHDAGYSEDTIERVRFLIRKKKLKRDAETQTLEDVACLVFLEHYFDPFAAKHPAEKTINVVRKTWAKMSPRGHQAALNLTLPAHL
ncbi:MAG: hypothetical protein ACI9WU_000698, partial [Myxococcota bacterium]